MERMRKIMKKKLISLVVGISVLGSVLAGCGKISSSENDKEIRVGASPAPHAEILEVIKDQLKEDGYTLKIVEYNDYVLPNTALEDGEIDANYFQHQPYLDDFNKNNGTHLVSVANVHYEPFGIYAGRTNSLDDLKESAVVAVPADSTNEARALLLLEANGLIKLKKDVGIAATVVDIVENPLNLKIKELESKKNDNN